MVFVTVLSARGASHCCKKFPWHTAMAKAPMILICCCQDILLRKILSPSPALLQVAVFEVADPRPSVVLVCVSTNCGLTGNQSSSKVSQEVTFLGRGTILKCLGSWEGQGEQKIFVSSLLDRSSSQERALVTVLSAPQNNWLYSRIAWER